MTCVILPSDFAAAEEVAADEDDDEELLGEDGAFFWLLPDDVEVAGVDAKKRDVEERRFLLSFSRLPLLER